MYLELFSIALKAVLKVTKFNIFWDISHTFASWTHAVTGSQALCPQQPSILMKVHIWGPASGARVVSLCPHQAHAGAQQMVMYNVCVCGVGGGLLKTEEKMWWIIVSYMT